MPLTSPCRQAQAQEQSLVPLLEALSALQEDQLEAVVALWWGTEQRARVQQGLEAGKMPKLILGSWTQEEEEAVSEEEEEDEKSMPSLPSTKPITY